MINLLGYTHVKDESKIDKPYIHRELGDASKSRFIFNKDDERAI